MVFDVDSNTLNQVINKEEEMNKWIVLTCICGLAFASFSFKNSQDAELQESMKAGKEVYSAVCLACHMDKGQGIPGVFPPLAKSDYLMADRERAVKNLIQGLRGEIIVNDKKYNQVMPASGLDDQDIANVLNYVMNSFGNKAEEILTETEVAKIRAGLD